MVAAVAAAASLGVQQLIARGEPAALKRLMLLSAAIETLPPEDTGRVDLEVTRTLLARRLAESLKGLTGFARVLWVAGWVGMVIGSLLLVLWILFILFAPKSTPSDLDTAFAILLGVSPVLLVYARLWPTVERGVDSLVALSLRGFERRRKNEVG